MFEKFKPFIGRRDLPNDFYPTTEGDIAAAERQMGFSFPDQLRLFYKEVGSGFYRLGAKDDHVNRFLINGIHDPGLIADLVCDPEHPWRPHVELEQGEIPFFDTGDRDYFLMNALSECPNRVLWQGGSFMMDSFIEFLDRLYDHAGFYANGPGTI